MFCVMFSRFGTMQHCDAMFAGLQRHLDTGEVDRWAEEGDQGQREPNESGADEASYTPV